MPAETQVATRRTGSSAPVLRVADVIKWYGATQALRGVSFELERGEILGLVGANGAGKTTLTSILTGAVRPTSGHIYVEGREVVLDHIDQASEQGIETIFQLVDNALVPEMSVARNLTLPLLVSGALGRAPSGKVIIGEARRIADGRLDVDLRTKVRNLPASQRQQLLIARALSTKPSVLILDEPTAALSVVEQARLHDDLRQLAANGTAIIYITHHLGEVVALCHSVIVLRDGLVTARLSRPFTAQDMVAPMLGELGTRTSEAADLSPLRHTPGAPVLELRGVRSRRGAAPSDLVVHENEVVGITGLIGAGKTELLLQVVGALPRISGQILWHGRELTPRHPGDAIRAGIGFVPEDRARQGEIPGWSVASMVTLPDLRRYRNRAGLLDRRREWRATRDVMDALHLVATGPRAPIESLSGGNRQKAIVGRWMAAGSELLIFDEPFRGVDIGSRADIASMLRKARCALVSSSDPEEILEIADRVLIAANGTIVGEVDPHSTTAEELTTLMTAGGDPR